MASWRWLSGRRLGSLLDEPLELARYLVFDLETTGTSPAGSRILEIGGRLDGLDAGPSFQRLVDPGLPVPEAITAITGIHTADVRGRPPIGRCLEEFLHFAAGAVLGAQRPLRHRLCGRRVGPAAGGRLAAPAIDTVALARRLLAGRLPRMTLAALAERFDTAVRPCHRALPDAEATAEVLVRLLGMAQEEGARTVGDVIEPRALVARRAPRRRELAAGAPPGPGVPVPWSIWSRAVRGQGGSPAGQGALLLFGRAGAAAG